MDNEALHNIYNNRGSTIHKLIKNLCKRLFWPKIEHEWHLRLEWVATRENKADEMTREEEEGHSVRQEHIPKYLGEIRSFLHGSHGMFEF